MDCGFDKAILLEFYSRYSIQERVFIFKPFSQDLDSLITVCIEPFDQCWYPSLVVEQALFEKTFEYET